MSANDYIDAVRKKNPTLFAKRDRKISISVESLEQQLKLAFDRGVDAGRNGKSAFEQIFGNAFK